MLPDDLRDALKHQFTRRFVFIGYSIVATLLGFLLLFLGLAHPNNTALLNGELIFAGFFNPYLLIGGVSLFMSVALYTIGMLGRELRLKSPHVEMSIHTTLAITSALILLILLNSAWMTETLKQVYGLALMPQLPPAAPANVLWIVSPLILITFLPHSVWYIYQVLLARMLNRAEMTFQTKRKRKNNLLSIADDEMFDPPDHEVAKQSRSDYSS